MFCVLSAKLENKDGRLLSMLILLLLQPQKSSFQYNFSSFYTEIFMINPTNVEQII